MKTPLSVEWLEDRCVPVTWGNPWPDALHLTLSFAPDGTMVGDSTSNLQSTLDAQVAHTSWELEILRAFQTWAINANINIGLVSDGGQPLGSAGWPQGDSRFGDVRLAGTTQPINPELAVASPFDILGGTWSGDVILNTSVNFGINGQGSVDLFSALLHEAGHVLGFDHNPDIASPLYETYQGVRTGLAASDIANVQALYGARRPDALEGSTGNDTFDTASNLSFQSNPDGSQIVAADGDLQSLSDRDLFRLQAPQSAGSLVVSLQAAGLSLLTSRVTVYDFSGNVVSSATACNPLNNDLSLVITNPTPNGVYFIKVKSAGNNVFGIGSYHLQVQALQPGQTATSTPGSGDALRGAITDDQHSDDSLQAASLLAPSGTQAGSFFDYGFRGNIRDQSDVDFYRVTAPQNPSGQETVLTVMVWGTENSGLKPRVNVYDAAQNLLDADVLVNANGTFTVQVRNATPGASYFVEVEAADAAGPNNVGHYFLGIDFSQRASTLDAITAGALGQNQPSQSSQLTVTQGQKLHLVLGAEGGPAIVHLDVIDYQGHVVASLEVQTGRDPVSSTQYLPAGGYLLQFTATTADGSPPPDVSFTLKGARLDDPIGPRPENGTDQPSGTTSGGTTTSGYSTPPTLSIPPSGSSQTDYQDYGLYYRWNQWYSAGGSTNPNNPYTNPYGSTLPPPPGPGSGASQAECQWCYQYYQWTQWYRWYYQGGGTSNPENPYTNPYSAS